MASISSTRPIKNTDAAADTRGRPGDAVLNRQLNEDGDALNRRKNEEHLSAQQKAQFFMSDISARAGQAVKGAAERMHDAGSAVKDAVSDVATDITGNKKTDKLVDVDLGSTSLRDRQRQSRLHEEEHQSELLKHPAHPTEDHPPLLRQNEMLHLQTQKTGEQLAHKLSGAGARTEVMPSRRLSQQQGSQTHALTTDDKPFSSSQQIDRPTQGTQLSQAQVPVLPLSALSSHTASSVLIPEAPALSPTWQCHNLEHGGSSTIPASAFDAGMAKSMGDIGEKAAKDVQKAWNAASDATARAAHKVAEKATAAGATVKEFFSEVGAQVKEDTHLAADKTAEGAKKAWHATSETAQKVGHTIAEDSKQFAHKVDEVAHKVADSTSQAAHNAKESTENVAHRVAHAVRDGAKRAGEAIVHAYDRAQAYFVAHPEFLAVYPVLPGPFADPVLAQQTAAAMRHAFEKTGETGAKVAETTVDGLAYTASAGAALGKQTVNAAEHATDVVMDKTKSALHAAGDAASYVGHATVETAKDAVQVSKSAVHNLAAKVADKTATENKDQEDLETQQRHRVSASLSRCSTDVMMPPAPSAIDTVDLEIDSQHHDLVPANKVVTPLADHQGKTVSDISTFNDKEREQHLPHQPTQTTAVQSSFGSQRAAQ